MKLCQFHGYGPIGLHVENTKWPISRKRKIFDNKKKLTSRVYTLVHVGISGKILVFILSFNFDSKKCKNFLM